MPQPRYRRTSGAVFNLHLHFVWRPKYRRKVLVSEVETRLRQLLSEKASELGVEQEFPALRSRMPSLWSRSYYVGSVGHVSTAVIQDYIARQKERG